MQIKSNFYNNLVSVSTSILSLLFSLLLVACGDVDGPAIEARSQSISFSAVPTLNLDETATASATASSGLAVSFSSMTRDVCSASSSGLVTANTPGDCIIAANQSGNTTFASAPQVTQSIPVIFDPNQTITFGPAPRPLSIHSIATVLATADSGLAVRYGSATPAICSVNNSSGLVEALAPGDCIITADQDGDTNYNLALQETQTITVYLPVVITEPGAPIGVTATLGDTSNMVIVTIGAVDSGGSPITGYTVSSIPSGFTETGTTTPITVTCDPACTGYAFSVIATNVIGDSDPSAPADVLTTYNVVETFLEPLTQPRDSIFIGTFTFNSTTSTVSNLQGLLSESMSGDLIAYPDDTMTWLPLNHQLSSVYDPVLGGLLVTTFLNDNTNTFSTMLGGDGWSPASGVDVGALYYGWPDVNPGNAYAMIFVNTQDPTAPLTQGQIDKLAYADCAPDGMMGGACMTGTTTAGYGSEGSMGGYPVSQEITKTTKPVTPPVFDPNQSITFDPAPTLYLLSTATVSATADSGLAVSYGSDTPAICSVNSSSGLVEALTPGDCVITANQAGDVNYNPAPQATLSIPVVFKLNQSITFDPAPILYLFSTATVSATADSGLAVSYGSDTPAICSVNSSSGLVEALTPGDCVITANQAGDVNYNPASQVSLSIPVIFDPNQSITFDPVPTLNLFSTATVSATASSGLAVSYGSATPAICSVNSSSGLVEALTPGDCVITANQAGDANYNPAPQEILTITVSIPVGITVPGAPSGVTATLGGALNEVLVTFGATDSGGSPITGYTVSSTPGGITGTGTATPITVTCPSTCTGYAFSVIATNVIGDGTPSAQVDVLTTYDVVETFLEPQTQPRDSIFIGSFTLNSTTDTVSNLQGMLSESMTGDPDANPDYDYGMTWLPLNNQLSSVYDPVLGGLLVTTFLNDNTNTFSTILGGDGWSPASGVDVSMLFYGWPDVNVNPGNAYAMIFVNTQDPTAPLTLGQLEKLAYADCAPGGMMGSACMTGTTTAGYGSEGSMGGYPVSQVITRQP